MALTEQDISMLELLLERELDDGELRHAFRELLPKRSLTVVDAADIDTETPWREFPLYLAYLIDDSHCRQIITNPAEASGVIVARRKQASAA